MLLIRFIRFFMGYLRIGVTGQFPERFLNLCASSGIRVWNTRRVGEGIEVCAYARDLRKMRQLRRRCSASLKVKRKYGLPFITARYKHRKGHLVGVAIYVTALVLLPKLVWGVTVSGNERITNERVSSALRDIGVYPGAKLSSLDADNMRVKLALLLPEISWSAINIDGCFVSVDLRESDQKLENDLKPSNMVAAFDGRIKAVYVKSGVAAVRVGDAVIKGDMLVSGTEQYSSGQTFFRHSDAKIIAETEQKLTVKIPLKMQISKDTGRLKKRYVLKVFDYSVPLYIGEVGFDYRLERESHPLNLFSTSLPISLTEGRFYEIEKLEQRLTKDKANKQALKALKALEKDEFSDFKILSKEISSDIKNDMLILNATYLCEGDIAKTEYFYVSGQ